jgi:hypothetical protein
VLITSMHGVSLWLMAAQLHIQLIMQACVEWLESSLPKRLVVDVLAGWLAASVCVCVPWCGYHGGYTW